MPFMRILCVITTLMLPALAWSQQEAGQLSEGTLDAREAALAEREQALATREEDLAAREAALTPVEETAAESEAEPSPWSGEVSLGYIASSGNTDTSSGAGRVKIMYTRNAWDNWIEAKGFGSSDDEGTTAETYEALGRSLYNFNEKNYGFGQLEWKKNRFSAYEEQWFETIGYGHRFLTGDVFKLNFEAGIGLTQQDAVISSNPKIIDTERGVVYTAGGEFIWQVTGNTKFEQFASANIGEDNTYWETITRLSVNIVDSLALSVGYTIQGNTDVADDVDRTDKYTAISLDYSF